MLWTLLWVALGAMFGASGRFLVGEAVRRLVGIGFPWGTMTVNLVGSFCMGLLFELIQRGLVTHEPTKIFIGIGFLGSFTTFSSFALDNANLLRASSSWAMLGNIVAQNVIGLLMIFLGMRVADWIS